MLKFFINNFFLNAVDLYKETVISCALFSLASLTFVIG